jgi:hypothetical protein
VRTYLWGLNAVARGLSSKSGYITGLPLGVAIGTTDLVFNSSVPNGYRQVGPRIRKDAACPLAYVKEDALPRTVSPFVVRCRSDETESRTRAGTEVELEQPASTLVLIHAVAQVVGCRLQPALSSMLSFFALWSGSSR